MNQSPKISIVTPSFNQVQYIEGTINSVLNQGYPNLEYIIIDGGSTDGSKEIIQKYQQHLTYWVSEPDNGQYDAINKGFSKSTGEIMAWINSDDRYSTNAFSIVLDIFMKYSEVDWITSLYPVSLNRKGQEFFVGQISGFDEQTFYRGGNLPQKNKYARSWIQQESTFWRRSLWQKSGGAVNATLKYAADFDLWAKFFEHTQLCGVNAIIGEFRNHESQKSANYMNDYIGEAHSILNKYGSKPYSLIGSLIRSNLNLLILGRSFEPFSKFTNSVLLSTRLFKKTSICRWDGNKWELSDRLIV